MPIQNKIYLDYAASTPIDKRVLLRMEQFLKYFANPSSIHSLGQEAKKLLEKSRNEVAKIINAEPQEIIFTSSATEANNLAIKGIAFEKGKGRILISSIEHKSVLEPALYLKNKGFKVKFVPVDKYGIINISKFKKMLRNDTILVSVIYASNEIGTIEPIKKIGEICKKKNIPFHTDAAQALGKLKIDVKKENIDLLTGSSHKIYGPKGVGFLYKQKNIKLTPLLHGGGQEFNLRSSTENLPAILGFAEALKIAEKERKKETKRIKKLRDKLIKGVLKTIPNSYLTGHPEKRLPNFASFRFDFVEGESIVMLLNEYGICASTASACASKEITPSHVLVACGLKPFEAQGSLRITLGKETKEKDIDYLLKILPLVIKKLRKLSPYGKR